MANLAKLDVVSLNAGGFVATIGRPWNGRRGIDSIVIHAKPAVDEMTAIRGLEMNLHERRSAPPANHHSPPETRLPPKLRAAFARYRPDPDRKRPYYPRDVRIGIEYSLRVTVDDIKSDTEADGFADLCITLAELDEADQARGDPPATGAARAKAEDASPQHGRAFSLLNSIRDCSHYWAKDGRAYPPLPLAQEAILQKAARAEKVDEAELVPVLEKAEELARLLSYPLLARPPS